MKKPDFSKFHIRSTRDWVIFWLFAALIAYIAADYYSWDVDSWLRVRGNPWLSEGNEPQSYGRMIIAAVLLALVAEVVCFLRRKRLRVKLAVLAAGVLVPVVLVGMYQINCRLITSVLWNEEPVYMEIFWRDQEEDNVLRYMPSPEEQAQLQELCRNMTVVSDEEVMEEFEDWHQQTNSFWKQDCIHLRFSEKYGHHYSLELYVWEDYFYFFRGHVRGMSTFVTLFKDDGLKEYMENLKREYVGAAE